MTIKLALPAALLAVLALSACQDDESASGSDDPTTEATSSETASETPTEASTDASSEATGSTEATDGAAPAGDVTAPGTELKIGDTAVLPLTYGTKGTATVEVTVTGITQGTAADLQKAKVKNAADYTPFYINLDLKILSTGAEGFGGYTGGSDFDGLIGDTKAGSLIVIGDFAPCDNEGFEYDAKAGDTAKTCVPALATKGSVVDGVQFSGGADEAGYDQFDGKPVVWH